MFPAATALMGLAEGFPDTCNTPSPAGPIPIPYPNIAEFAMANPETCADTVLLSGMPAMVKTSEVTLTEGDDAGTLGGIISGEFSGPGSFTLGSFTTVFGGRPAAYLTCMMGLNGVNANCPLGVHVEPSQEFVTINP